MSTTGGMLAWIDHVDGRILLWTHFGVVVFLFAKQTKPSKRRTSFRHMFSSNFLQLNACCWRGFFEGFCFDFDFTACTGFISDECNSFSWFLLALTALQRLAAFSSVRSDDSRRRRSFSWVSLTPNTIRSRSIVSCWSPNSQDFTRVFSSVINWSINSPSCCLFSQNRWALTNCTEISVKIFRQIVLVFFWYWKLERDWVVSFTKYR